MNKQQCFEWATEHHALGDADAARVRELIDLLCDARTTTGVRASHFNACLNSRDGFQVVKLVHVARNDAAIPRQERRAIAKERRAILVQLLGSLNQVDGAHFDVDLLARVYDAFDSGGVDCWYPIVSFDYAPALEKVLELSLYCADAPRAAANAAATALGILDSSVEDGWNELHALGLDFLASGGWRFKPYRVVSPSSLPELARQLHPSLHSQRFLALARLSSDRRGATATKGYVELFTRDGPAQACGAADLVERSEGRVGEFIRSLAPVLTGQAIYYVGASDEKVELYFGVEPVPPDDRLWREDEASLRAASRDFGNVVTRRCARVARARNEEDVKAVVDFARRTGQRVTVRGQGHSTAGQAVPTEGGISLDLTTLTGVELDSSTVSVRAGTRWDALLGRTLERGLMPPTLTDYLGLSVGGTLSVGGVGGQSFRHALQTDQVEALTVVTGAGDVVECSELRERDLFDACRATLGQCGVIVKARLRLMRAPTRVWVQRLLYDDAAEWLEDQLVLSRDGRVDYMLGSIIPKPEADFAYVLEVARYEDSSSSRAALALVDGLRCRRDRLVAPTALPFFDYANRLVELEARMKRDWSWYARHPWMDLFVASEAMPAFLRAVLSELDPVWLADSHTLTYVIAREACRTPLSTLPEVPLCFLFGIGPNFSRSREAELLAFEQAICRVYERACSLPVGVYPIGFPVASMTIADWSRQLGRSWDRFVAAKVHYDPAGVLPSTWGVDPACRRTA